MATKIKITFDPAKIAAELPRKEAQVMNTFEPGNGYTDSEAYEGTRFDANRYGMDIIVDEANDYAHTHIPMSVPLANIDLAIMGTKEEDGTSSYEFEVNDYKEVVYYQQIGYKLADQGITVTVTPAAAA